SIILRMQTAEMERKRALEKDEKLQNDIKFLNEQLNQSKTEIEDLRNRFTTLNAQAEADAVTKDELEAQIRKLTKEKEELNEKEAKVQEALKKQYQRLMKEKLNEERTQFEIKLKAVSATPSPVLNQENSEENSDFIVNNLKSIHTANIRRLENQISFYQTQLQNSNQSRDELSEEVLVITQEIEQLREQVKTKNELEQQYQQLNKRYQTLLELLGERTEEVEELKADLQDVKDMYKSQIVELVQKIDQLSGKK
ncbi:MAG: TATA element modulatory factor 1 TATA binding-domain-containing protein, partial [Benjaminiella poitrasii]